MNWPHLLFGIRGRTNRAKWWIASLGLVAIGFVVSRMIDSLDVEAVAKTLTRSVATVLVVALALVSLLVVYCLLAVAVKRLHDRNKRGWWILLFLLAPVILASVVGALGEDLAPVLGYALSAVALVIAGWALIEFGGLPGTAGLNRYGPDPLARIRGDPRPGGGGSQGGSEQASSR
jgi:uncharacterized membrane protein YhaH (DUF805 family)